jgi:uncharacterized membrane protein YhaH (DUF805 family)
MTLTESVSKCIKNYATFEGRASRSEYWWFWLVVTVLSYIPFVGCIIALAAIIPLLAAGVRRMHDTNHSGWWIICPIVNLVFSCFDSDPNANEYGPTPID